MHIIRMVAHCRNGIDIDGRQIGPILHSTEHRRAQIHLHCFDVSTSGLCDDIWRVLLLESLNEVLFHIIMHWSEDRLSHSSRQFKDF
jgi:hypothetical protein